MVTTTVTCDLWAPPTGYHLLTCGTIFRLPHQNPLPTTSYSTRTI